MNPRHHHDEPLLMISPMFATAPVAVYQSCGSACDGRPAKSASGGSAQPGAPAACGRRRPDRERNSPAAASCSSAATVVSMSSAPHSTPALRHRQQCFSPITPPQLQRRPALGRDHHGAPRLSRSFAAERASNSSSRYDSRIQAPRAGDITDRPTGEHDRSSICRRRSRRLRRAARIIPRAIEARLIREVRDVDDAIPTQLAPLEVRCPVV